MKKLFKYKPGDLIEGHLDVWCGKWIYLILGYNLNHHSYILMRFPDKLRKEFFNDFVENFDIFKPIGNSKEK